MHLFVKNIVYSIVCVSVWISTVCAKLRLIDRQAGFFLGVNWISNFKDLK